MAHSCQHALPPKQHAGQRFSGEPGRRNTERFIPDSAYLEFAESFRFAQSD